MDKHVFDIDKFGAHVFPFLWVHGEDNSVIRNEISAIRDAGIKMFCVESRPHPEFCEGEKWWKDFGYILSVAKEFGMKVWLLDDKHFPTGYAVGAVEKEARLKQKNIRAFFVDFLGEGEPCKFIVNDENSDVFIGAFVFERAGDGINYDSGVEVSGFYGDRVVSLPKTGKGFFRLVVLFESTRFFELENYIDMLNPKSAELQIKAVYEPTYEHFKEYFGNTFIGFFSDEPRFSNGRSEPQWMMKTMYRTQVGQIGATYPYRHDIAELLGVKDKMIFVALWFDCGEKGERFRIDYMNLVTRLYRDNFSRKIGKWCNDRGVLYTGHVTEDMGNHTRLGSGTGHFFRSMEGQNIAGIDVVLHQIESGFSHYKHIYPCPELYDDPDFFRFTLPKLAVSAAHTEPLKKNRAMCEIFGAYGWGESVNFMKYLVDFMLVRGINYFVPHAFNPKTDDSDCPPYFYHGGKNPQYPAFCELMKYTERMCGLLSADYSVNVAVLYHAEAEWSGAGYRPADGVCRALSEAQIDFGIVPSEYLQNTDAKVLVIPYYGFIGAEAEDAISAFNGEKIYLSRSEKELPDVVKGLPREYSLENPNIDIRVIKRGKYFFVFNEGITEEKNAVLFNGKRYSFRLLSEESVLIDTENFVLPKEPGQVFEVSRIADVFIKGFDKSEYSYIGKRDYVTDIREEDGLRDFCGTVRYELEVDYFLTFKKVLLDFGKNENAIKIVVNGIDCGFIYGAPYCADITNALQCGKNTLSIELSTTLALHYKDMFSKYCKIPKCGMLNAIELKCFSD